MEYYLIKLELILLDSQWKLSRGAKITGYKPLKIGRWHSAIADVDLWENNDDTDYDGDPHPHYQKMSDIEVTIRDITNRIVYGDEWTAWVDEIV